MKVYFFLAVFVVFFAAFFAGFLAAIVLTTFHAVRDLPVALLGITRRILSGKLVIVGEGNREETGADDLRQH